MTADEQVEQADAAVMLQLEAFTLGLHNPAVWDRYMDKWTENVNRRIDDHFGRNPTPDGGSANG